MSGLTTIFDNGDFSYLVQIEPTFWEPETGYTLAIYSRRASAKNPSEAQQRFFACLDRHGLEQLGRLITEQLSRYRAEYTEERRQSPRRTGDMSRVFSSVFRNGADLSSRKTP